MDSISHDDLDIPESAPNVSRPAQGSGTNFIHGKVHVNLFEKWSGILIRQTLIIVGVQFARLAAAAISGNSNVGLLAIVITMVGMHDIFRYLVEPLLREN